MDRLLFLTLDGLSRGAIYAAFALALVLIWRGARIVNFAQGAMATATAYLAYVVWTATNSFWLALAAAIVGGLLLGAVVDLAVMRFVGHTAHLNAVIVALGLVLIIQSVLGMIFGPEDKPLPAPVSKDVLIVDEVRIVSPYNIFVFGAVVLLVVLLALLFTRTPVGLRLRAAAFAPEVARLLGVNVRRMLTLGWSLAAAAGALAAVLIIPGEVGVTPHAMDIVFVGSFTAAVIGGLDSLGGAVVGGLALGLVLSYISGYANPNVGPLATLALLLAVLLIRPQGLFAARKARQV